MEVHLSEWIYIYIHLCYGSNIRGYSESSLIFYFDRSRN